MKRSVFRNLPALPAPLRGLGEMACNFQWSWDPRAVELWKDLGRMAKLPEEEAARLNPVAILQKLERRELQHLSRDREFLARCRAAHGRFTEYMKTPASARLDFAFTPQFPAAYFSMEFGIHHSLPVYAGGLGILAGDHLKSASDIGLPLAAVSLIYRKGYFRQQIGRAGQQEVLYPSADYRRLPLDLVRRKNGAELRVTVQFPGKPQNQAPRQVHLRIWKAQVGRVPLFLLDTDFDLNLPADRKLTHRLYSSPREERMAQELLLGVGGVRALRAMDIQPAVWHLNEGHVAFCALERIRELLVEGDLASDRPLTFHEAAETAAASTIFTTHTPVPEGNEMFDLRLARRYLEPTCRYAGIQVDEFLRLGLDFAADGGDPFLSMTVLAIRLSRFRNGVSRLHGEVSRRMWKHLWPGFSEAEVPITSVTNGVHMPTWVAPGMDDLLIEHAGPRWRSQLDNPAFWDRVSRIPDAKLWEQKKLLRRRLVEEVRRRTVWNLRRNGKSEREIERAVGRLLDPEALTIGFSRRFALYKRAALIFRDRKKAEALFNNPRRPVQIIFAGKPHPEDPAGRKVFEEVVAISKKPAFLGKVAVLENYDIGMAQAIVQGADIWLNNPRRPLEASGTSGQKVPINGGMNASILDGWWAEGYSPEAGWAFGDPSPYEDHALQDDDDASALHAALAGEVVPLFFRRGRDGIPGGWLKKLKKSMALLIPRFNTDHMVREYYRRLYLPALEYSLFLQAGGYRVAKDLAAWRERIAVSWPLVHRKGSSMRAAAAGQVFELDLFLGGLAPGDIELRACADRRAASKAGADLQASEWRTPQKVQEIDSGLWRFRFVLPRGAGGAGGGVRVNLRASHPCLAHAADAGLMPACARPHNLTFAIADSRRI